MASDVNTVNIKSDERGYHHGNLRAALVEAGLELLKVDGAEHLSLREIARRTNVSASSVYRHFPDKTALLTALAAAGLAQLAQLQHAAAACGGAKGFAESGRAYVRFALANPALFRLAYRFMPEEVRPSGESYEGSSAWLLHKCVAEVLGPQSSDQERLALAVRAWALVHGLAMLMLDGLVPQDDAMIERVVAASVLTK